MKPKFCAENCVCIFFVCLFLIFDGFVSDGGRRGSLGGGGGEEGRNGGRRFIIPVRS